MDSLTFIQFSLFAFDLQTAPRLLQEDKSEEKNEEDKSEKCEKNEDEEKKKEEEEKDEKEDSRWVLFVFDLVSLCRSLPAVCGSCLF